MKLHYLGTGAAEGWPAIFCHCENCMRARKAKGKNYRSRAQMLIDDKLMVDLGPDTFYHMMKYDLDFSELEHVLLTHSHEDHFCPSELLFKAYPFAHEGEKNKMTIYGNEKCHWLFLHMLEVQDNSDNLRDCAGFQEISASGPFEIPGYRITPLHAVHDTKEECLIYLIRDQEGKTLLYANDTGIFPEDTWKELEGIQVDCVSLDCTLGKDPDMGSGHMGLQAVRSVVKRMKETGCIREDTRVVLTHFSHNGGLLHEELERETEKDGFIIAYDGMLLEI